ncbi:hemolymph lipopolysaccharide-binding protein [Anabrus simplex]|uniref:hemolymph lipopolysaccharide-binding protein n=1 Tax=Anabrus simplex TaxID=316456 RepID=UPI0035A3A1EA
MFCFKTYAAILLLLVVNSSLQDQCSRSVHLSVRSSRNQTGHWHTRLLWVNGPHSTEMDNRETFPAYLDVHQSSQGCSSGEDTVSLEAIIKIPPRLAGPGYALYPGLGRYKFYSTPAVWETARQTCSEEGAHLAIIRSKQQEDALKEMFARYPNITGSTWSGAAWLGVHDQHNEDNFLTVLGEPLSQIAYTNWDSGKPDNKVYGGRKIDSDCVAMLRKGALIDLPCDARYAFVCEQELG